MIDNPSSSQSTCSVAVFPTPTGPDNSNVGHTYTTVHDVGLSVVSKKKVKKLVNPTFCNSEHKSNQKI
jgi:hypothetical protein